MDARTAKRIETADALYARIRSDLSWQQSYALHLAALSFAVGGRPYDRDRMKALMARIRGSFGVFSTYRSSALLLASFFLSQTDDADAAVDRLVALEPLLRSEGVRSYSFAPLLSAVLVRDGTEEDLPGKVARTKEVAAELQRAHPFLTGADDLPFAALLAVADGPVAARLPEVASLYFLLHLKGLSKGNGLQMLALVLALGPEPAVRKAERIADLRGRLDGLGIPVWPQHYPALGLLALLPDPRGNAAVRAAEVVGVLRSKRNYRGLDKGMALLIAAALLADDATRGNPPVVAGTAAVAILEAQAAAMVAAMAAATSAATAAAV